MENLAVDTKFKALFVKSLRVCHGYTWRAVAREFNTRYVYGKPFGYYVMDEQGIGTAILANQLDGMDICEQAQDMLGEDTHEDGWN